MTGARMKISAFGAAALLAAGIGGCGDSGGASVDGTVAGAVEEEGAVEEIEAAAARLEQAVADRDSRAFCRVLAPSAVQRLGGGETDGRRECLRVWGPARNPLFRAKRVPDLSVERVSFRGTYATAQLGNGGKLAFSREGGSWYVQLAPGRAQGRKR
jgi:hypothetical protein